jgi:hypothetical protein
MLRTLAWCACFGLTLAACGGQATEGSATAPPAPVALPTPVFPAVIARGVPIAQNGPADLTIRYVERLPAIDYVWRSPDPRVEGWPAPGSQVTWRAHLKNWSGALLVGVDYAWTLDRQPVGSGTIDVPSRSEALVDLPRTWDASRHVLELAVDSGNRFTVRDGPRNRLLVHTDALAIGFYAEQTFYDYFRDHQHELRIGNSSFEDWAQLQVVSYNQILEKAVYPETPNGVVDRVRLDKVTVVPDGSLPLDPLGFTVGGGFGAPQARPNVADRTVDMQWGFPSSVLSQSVPQDRTSLETNNQFYYSGFLQHELGHARYLIDVYGFDVFHGTAGSRIDITESGAPVPGSRYMPGTPAIVNGVSGIRVHQTPYQGLMSTTWTYLDRYSAVGWNRIAGHRATLGNYNEPENIGVFLEDLPEENRLTLRDAGGAALGGASVRVYRAEPGEPGAPYAKRFDDAPDLELRADGEGRVRLGRNPFSGSGPLVHTDQGYSNGVVILRVEHEGRVGYAFLEVSELNFEFWRGHVDLGEYELRLNLL